MIWPEALIASHCIVELLAIVDTWTSDDTWRACGQSAPAVSPAGRSSIRVKYA